ncbi:MAG: proline--tRNA ligase [Proteobacteria bacterium]|nr:MAG: proline--tRNA ligase [Pseudomonadota bacterium]
MRYVDTRIPSQNEDYSAWYHAVVKAGMIAKQSPVPGCQILEENGADLWKEIERQFDPMIRNLGYRNKSWPALIPMSIFMKEQDHIDGFSPELAMIPKLKGRELDDQLCLRPTSETVIYDDMAGVVQSAKDLPIKWNQWCDVWRVEMRTKLLLRTFQFSWHESHWAMERHDDALQHTLDALNKYKVFCQEVLAIPVIDGEKSERERFAGADKTFTIEARMPDGKALQAGTSHLMGKGFADAYGISFAGRDGEPCSPFTGSWGMSTRIMGAIVMTHSDDRGLVLPPRISPYQVVLMVVQDSQTQDCSAFQKKVQDIKQALEKSSARFTIDDTDERLGKKQFHWEKQGVPIRIVYGANEMQDGTVTLIRRDTGAKLVVAEHSLQEELQTLLIEIQKDLLSKASKRLSQETVSISTLKDFETAIESQENGFFSVGWCDEVEAELHLKERYGYTIRCYPLNPETSFSRCFLTGKPSKTQAIVAKAY